MYSIYSRIYMNCHNFVWSVQTQKMLWGSYFASYEHASTFREVAIRIQCTCMQIEVSIRKRAKCTREFLTYLYSGERFLAKQWIAPKCTSNVYISYIFTNSPFFCIFYKFAPRNLTNIQLVTFTILPDFPSPLQFFDTPYNFHYSMLV